jgi:asparagine N-glycosylation enzyme membrane subunit Stt3
LLTRKKRENYKNIEEERKMKIDWKQKLTSRKLWMAVAGFATGLVALFAGGATEINITGAVMSLGSVIAYIIGEGLTDAAHK